MIEEIYIVGAFQIIIDTNEFSNLVFQKINYFSVQKGDLTYFTKPIKLLK